MREGWGVDSPYGYPHNLAYPFCVNDDGTALTAEENERFFGRCDIMSQNDNRSWGEKPVSHIKVVDYSLDPEVAAKVGRPTTAVYTTWGYGQWYWTHHVDTFVNGFHERVYKHLFSTPRETDCWYDITYTMCENTNKHYLTYYGGSAYCSPSYGKEYGRDPKGYDPGTSQRYIENSGQIGFTARMLSREQALRYYALLAPHHQPDGGEYSEIYREALLSVGADVNSLANIASIVDLVHDIKKGRLFEAAESASDATKLAARGWLGYRYAYNTTKSDIEEYREAAARLARRDYTKWQISRAGLTNEAGTFHCKVRYKDNIYGKFEELVLGLERSGLMFNEYVAWDFVPFSFVVDWFLPIGDILEDISEQHVAAERGYFSIDTITMSFKWTDSLLTSTGRVVVTSYTRSVTTEPPPFAIYHEDPSTSTVIKRWIDGGALLIS